MRYYLPYCERNYSNCSHPRVLHTRSHFEHVSGRLLDGEVGPCVSGTSFLDRPSPKFDLPKRKNEGLPNLEEDDEVPKICGKFQNDNDDVGRFLFLQPRRERHCVIGTHVGVLVSMKMTKRGSAATALACAACSVQGSSFLGISSELFLLAYVASLSTKLADTFASEIGKAYGKTTFLITTLERVEPGTEGAVSAEGTAAAVVGGLLLSLYGWAIGLISGPAVPISVAAAFIATNIESVLGATLQGKEELEWITNEVVNFINTLIGAAIAIAAGMAFL